MNTTRSRWAAIGAAVAVTLGAGGVGISQATTDSGDGPVAAFFPIEPCRLAADATIAEDASIALDGWGTTGACELPDNITGLAANVTAVNATAQTNLRLYAQGSDVPETANLNPTPGAAPTPNAVNITLNDTNGQFEVYNRFGSVGVFIDVMGYYDNHTHDDRYYTKEQIDTGFVATPNGEMWVSLYDFSELNPSGDWQFDETWRHAGGGDDCLLAKLPLPLGSTVGTVEVSYFATMPGDVSVVLYAVRRAPGSLLGAVNDDEQEVPFSATPIDAAGVASVDFDGFTLRPDDDPAIAICTADTFAFTGVRVLFD